MALLKGSTNTSYVSVEPFFFQSHLPHIFWAHVVGHAVHIINKLPTVFLQHKSPYQILYNKLPDLNNLKVFGSL